MRQGIDVGVVLRPGIETSIDTLIEIEALVAK